MNGSYLANITKQVKSQANDQHLSYQLTELPVNSTEQTNKNQ